MVRLVRAMPGFFWCLLVLGGGFGTYGASSVPNKSEALAHYSTALAYEMRRDFGKALEHYYLASMADPTQEALVLDTARKLVRTRSLDQLERAEQLLSRASQAGEVSGELIALHGFTLSELGRVPESILKNREALDRVPGLLPAYANLAQLHLKQGETDEALKVLQEAYDHVAEDPGELLTLSELYQSLAAQKPTKQKIAREAVRRICERVEKLKTRDSRLQQRLGDGWIFAGEAGKAEGVYVDLFKRFPDMPGVREKLADLYLEGGKPEQAVELLEELIRSNPTHVQLYILAGQILSSRVGNHDKAVEFLNRALAMQPANEGLHYMIAEVYFALNNPRSALDILGKARERFQPTFSLEFLSGIAHGYLDEYDEAVRSLTSAEIQARVNEPERLDHVFYFHLGANQERAGNLDEAAVAFHRALELKPNFVSALNYLGYMWADKGIHLKEALGMIQKAVEAEPESAAYLDSLAWVYFRLGKLKEAHEAILKAIQHMEEPDATLLDHWGDIEFALGNLDKAIEAWKKAVKSKADEVIQKKLDQALKEQSE